MTTPKIQDIDPRVLLQPHSNPNVMSAEKFDLLREGIRRYGFLQPILVRVDGDELRIVDGVHRVRAAAELDLPTITAVIMTEDTAPEDIAALLQIGMNRNRGELDLAAVAKTFGALAARGWEPPAIALSGFGEDEVRALLGTLRSEEIDPRAGGVNAPEKRERPEKAEHPLTLIFSTKKDLALVKRALKRAGSGDRGLGAVILASRYESTVDE